jgi:ABC-type iron transport system FetAB ATPase subunit
MYHPGAGTCLIGEGVVVERGIREAVFGPKEKGRSILEKIVAS